MQAPAKAGQTPDLATAACVVSALTGASLSPHQAECFAKMFAALGDEGRLGLYRLIIRSGAMGLADHEIADREGLAILDAVGLVTPQDMGRTRIYRATPGALAECLEGFLPTTVRPRTG